MIAQVAQTTAKTGSVAIDVTACRAAIAATKAENQPKPCGSAARAVIHPYQR